MAPSSVRSHSPCHLNGHCSNLGLSSHGGSGQQFWPFKGWGERGAGWRQCLVYIKTVNVGVRGYVFDFLRQIKKPNLMLCLNLNNTNLIYVFFWGGEGVLTMCWALCQVFTEQPYQVGKIISLILQMKKEAGRGKVYC